jgi:hypothetical protein
MASQQNKLQLRQQIWAKITTSRLSNPSEDRFARRCCG